MSKKRYINTIFWRDSYISNLDPSEKLMFLYLITNPDTNIIGVYQMPIRQISVDTGFEKDMCIKILDRFQADGKILYKDGWIAIKNFAKHQNYKSPFIQTGIENEFSNIPSFIQTWCRDGIETVLNKHLYINKSKSKSIVFKRPDSQIIQNYLDELGEKRFTGKEFYDSNEAKGWVIGKNRTPMKDWKAAVRTWINKKNADMPKSQYKIL